MSQHPQKATAIIAEDWGAKATVQVGRYQPHALKLRTKPQQHKPL